MMSYTDKGAFEMHAKLSKIALTTVHAAVVAAVAASAHAKSSADSIGTSANLFTSSQPGALQPYFKALYVEGEHNAVLNLEYLGLAALESGEYLTAEKAFDAAISRVEAIYADNPSAQKAKSLFAEEKVKDFKGEPYERAMAYYYRGLLYARSGDYQNARASFLSAEAQSTMSERESYESTFGLMDYLAAWASHCDGDDSKADELATRAVRLQPQPYSRLSAHTNFLGLIDFGAAPRKVGVGQYSERLTFTPSGEPPTVKGADVSNVKVSAFELGADLNWQASTRGGRPVDAILNGKALWKSATEGASTAVTTTGYAAMLQGMASGNQGLQQAGEIGMVVGLVGGLFAHAMTPAADTRAWQSIPAGIALVEGNLLGTGAPQMQFIVEGNDAPIAATMNSQAGQCSVSWGRVGPGVEDATKFVANPSAAEAKHENVNRQFRSFLESTFAPVRSAAIATSMPTSEESR
jgi:tetratricopeptide (TPR) repeat protein